MRPHLVCRLAFSVSLIWRLVLSKPIFATYYTLDLSTSYEEKVLAFALQGLVNRHGPKLFIDTGALNIDNHNSEKEWKAALATGPDGVQWSEVSDLCTLIQRFQNEVAGTVFYPTTVNDTAVPLALTISGVLNALPLTTTLSQRQPCFNSFDVLENVTWLASLSKVEATKWVRDKYLSRCSKGDVWNGNHRDPWTSPQYGDSAITSTDIVIRQGGFFTNFVVDPHCPDEAQTFLSILSAMGPLVNVWGWSDPEWTYVEETTKAGAIVLCSFATPNLSFWKSLGELRNITAMKLPGAGSTRSLEPKTYLTFETNEGDTPRILVAQFGSSWLDKKRGSVPVSWSVDPYLGDSFPALWNALFSTATANDTFMFGVSGAGYVQINNLWNETTKINAPLGGNVKAYENRVGQLIRKLGPPGGSVVDVYGGANRSQMEEYQANAGGSVAAFVNPGGDAKGNDWLHDGTPMVKTGKNLFYFTNNLNQSAPAKDLALRILNASRDVPRPGFINVYGGLKWTEDAQANFFDLIRDTMELLGPNFQAIGAQEMARLARTVGKQQQTAIVV